MLTLVHQCDLRAACASQQIRQFDFLRDLSLGIRGPRRSTDVTNATLSDRLRHLEDNGLIKRRQYQSNPERYEYVLTPKGRDVILVIQALAQVGDNWALLATPARRSNSWIERPVIG